MSAASFVEQRWGGLQAPAYTLLVNGAALGPREKFYSELHLLTGKLGHLVPGLTLDMWAG